MLAPGLLRVVSGHLVQMQQNPFPGGVGMAASGQKRTLRSGGRIRVQRLQAPIAVPRWIVILQTTYVVR
jgi:hypothetical protein